MKDESTDVDGTERYRWEKLLKSLDQVCGDPKQDKNSKGVGAE